MHINSLQGLSSSFFSPAGVLWDSATATADVPLAVLEIGRAVDLEVVWTISTAQDEVGDITTEHTPVDNDDYWKGVPIDH